MTLGSATAWRRSLHDDVETLVGVVDKNVLLADGAEAVAVEFADALGKRMLNGLNSRSGRSAVISCTVSAKAQ